MKVRIISGAYGYRRDTDASPELILKGRCVDVPEDEAARLVSLHVAEFCEDMTTAPVATPEEPVSGIEPGETMGEVEQPAEGQETAFLDAEQMQGMTVSALKKLAEDMGIDTKKLRTKAQLIAAICDVPLEDCIEEDAELPPVLEAGAPVV